MSIFTKIFGDANEKYLKGLKPIIDDINAREEAAKGLSREAMAGRTREFQARLRDLSGDALKAELDAILPEAFALAREAARRVIGQRHYDVQLAGGIVLHRGQIAEMKTGEGKTLVATLPLFLNALAGRGAHLVTVNDYLARVGAGWMAPVFHYLGLTTGVIVHETGYVYDPEYADESQYDPRLKRLRRAGRREAYLADITYGTNNEYGFDYLRDNMVGELKDCVQRALFYAIVDEIDSILIDEARTPLIISAPAEESTDKYQKFAQYVSRLKENEDYNLDEKMRSATLTEQGISRMEKMLGVENIYTAGGIREAHHIEQALKAMALFKRDRDYVVKDGEIIIVDEFTGRLMHGRRYSEGLHQAIEAKEGVKVQRESQTLATVTFQNFFRMYAKLAGMTGTAVTEAEEFAKIYNLETVIVPTHRPMVRADLNDLVYRSRQGKYQAVVEEVKRRHAAGQPVLVGTISIEQNEELAQMMERAGLKPNVLNAKNHEKEAKFIADAGRAGSITIATNMAGRGVDIMLGGSSLDGQDKEEWRKEHDRIVALGGLHVIGTERHEARRIDNQLRGRAGRQGDPGSSQFFVSMEDDLMRIFGGERMRSIMTSLNVPEDMPIENRLVSKSIESAQTKVEGNNFDIRKHLVEYDDVVNKHREAIYGKRREILYIYEKMKSRDASDGDGLISNFQFPISNKIPNDQNPNAKNDARTLSEIILGYIENEIEQVVAFHTAAEYVKDWNLNEVYQTMNTIFPVDEELKADLTGFTVNDNHKLDKAKARTAIIERLMGLARERYAAMKDRVSRAGVDWPSIEKAVLIRSIDTLWVEHLEAIASVRQGIGLRGYGQRDPLVEYKREAFQLYGELNSLVQKEVAYSVFKLASLESAPARQFAAPSLADRASVFSAPAKEMSRGARAFLKDQSPTAGQGSQGGAPVDLVRPKARDEFGDKVGRNDPCPCGSGKKYKKCHGA